MESETKASHGKGDTRWLSEAPPTRSNGSSTADCRERDGQPCLVDVNAFSGRVGGIPEKGSARCVRGSVSPGQRDCGKGARRWQLSLGAGCRGCPIDRSVARCVLNSRCSKVGP